MSLPATFVAGFHDEAAVRKMEYGPLGNTGLVVSKLGLGGASLCHIYGEFGEEEAIKTLRAGLKMGINYIDTAPWYGQGRSEEVIGKALKGVPREAYYIATKIGRYELDPLKMTDFTAKKTRESLDKSLRLLGLDHVDVIQAHDLEFADNLDDLLNEALPTMKELIKEGKARFMSVTGYPVSILKEAVERSKVQPDCVLSYARDTLIDNTLQSYIPFFKERKMAVINAAGPAMGLLTNQGPLPWHPATDEQKKVAKMAADYCKTKGVELGRLAVYHSYHRPGVDINLIGMNTMELLNSNVEILLSGISDLEMKTYEEVMDKFFSQVKVGHWEGVEVTAHQKAKKAALAKSS